MLWHERLLQIHGSKIITFNCNFKYKWRCDSHEGLSYLTELFYWMEKVGGMAVILIFQYIDTVRNKLEP